MTKKINDGLDIKYDQLSDTVEIEGIKYAGDLFRKFGSVFELGTMFVILSRNDGVIEVRRVTVHD